VNGVQSWRGPLAGLVARRNRLEALPFALSYELVIFRGAGTGRGIRGQAAGPRWDQIAQSGRQILVDGSAGAEVAGQKRDGEDDSKLAGANWHQRTAGITTRAYYQKRADWLIQKFKVL
jgi:hypothetical protein